MTPADKEEDPSRAELCSSARWVSSSHQQWNMSISAILQVNAMMMQMRWMKFQSMKERVIQSLWWILQSIQERSTWTNIITAINLYPSPPSTWLMILCNLIFTKCNLVTCVQMLLWAFKLFQWHLHQYHVIMSGPPTTLTNMFLL